MPSQWYIKTKNGFRGPFTSKELRRLAQKGTLTPNTGVSRDKQKWAKAKRISGLAFAEPSDARDAASDDPTRRWYIQTKGGIVGPVSVSRLSRMANDGRIRPNVAVSHDKETWIKAKRVPGVDFPKSLPPKVHQRVELPVIQELPIVGKIPDLDDLPLRRSDVIKIALPVVDELPFFGPLPTIDDLPLRRCDVVKVMLPVIQEIPIAGPVPKLEDLPRRRSDVTSIRLPVIQEIPIVGPIPSLQDLPPRREDVIRIALPVIHEIPIYGELPTLADLEPQVSLDNYRRSALVKHLGQLWQVDGPTTSQGKLADVCINPASHERPLVTMVTNGMSDVGMDVPTGASSRGRTDSLCPRAQACLRHSAAITCRDCSATPSRFLVWSDDGQW